MLTYRVIYTKEGKELVAPFLFNNLQQARQAREVYKDSGAINIVIVVERAQDNIKTKLFNINWSNKNCLITK